MKLREWINQNAPLITVIGILIMCICLFYLMDQLKIKPTGGVRGAWFYDLQNNQLFVGPNSAIPPIPIPSGQKDANGNDQGVRAIVFSCGRCDEASRYIGYLETMTPQAREQIRAMMDAANDLPPAPSTQPATAPANFPVTPPATRPIAAASVPTQAPVPMADPMMSGRLVSTEDPVEWFSMDAPEAGKLIQKSMSKCGEGKYPTQCFPNQ